MLKATTIDPEKRKSRITCHACRLSYTARDYALLYAGQKLAYFRFKPPNFKRQRVFCHNCFYKSTVEQMSGQVPIDVEMDTLTGTIVITFFRK
jgi:hypothetical protein